MADSEILERLRQYDIYPNEGRGQHILIDPYWLGYIAGYASPDAHVIEIGAGPGNLTERIAAHADRVTAIEIDPQYEDILSDLSQQHTNVTVVMGDALSVDYETILTDRDQDIQVIANPPYHIAEPLLRILATLPMKDAVLTVGDRLSVTLRETDPSHPDFTRLSLLALGFFHVELLAEIPRNVFYPPPRTDSHLISLTPKGDEALASPAIRIIQKLFLLADQTSVGNIIRTALQEGVTDQVYRSKQERNRHDRRETRRWLSTLAQNPGSPDALKQDGLIYSDPGSRLQIPDHILSSRFLALNNNDLQTLTQEILEIYPSQ